MEFFNRMLVLNSAPFHWHDIYKLATTSPPLHFVSVSRSWLSIHGITANKLSFQSVELPLCVRIYTISPNMPKLRQQICWNCSVMRTLQCVWRTSRHVMRACVYSTNCVFLFLFHLFFLHHSIFSVCVSLSLCSATFSSTLTFMASKRITIVALVNMFCVDSHS